MGTETERLLVLINPQSGVGQALCIFNEMLLPELERVAVSYDLIITEHANHAKLFVVNCEDLRKYTSIITISGDGLIFEVVNGLLQRVDREYCLSQIPLGLVPVGSGNALLSSVFNHLDKLAADTNEFVRSAISAVCNMQTNAYPVNLMHVETPTESFGAFLSVGYGLLSDIDIESERWRKTLGRARFTVGAVIRCFLGLRIYSCRLSFLKSDDVSCNVRKVHPFKVYGRRNSSLAVEEEKESERHSNEFDEMLSSDEFLRRSHLPDAVPKLSEPVPSEWSVIEDDFIFIYAMALSHIGHNALYISDAELNDGNIYLTYALKKDVQSKMELFRFLLDIGTAQHMNYSFFKTVRVRSLRIEPTTEPFSGGIFVVDGESVNCGKLQATATSSTIAVTGG